MLNCRVSGVRTVALVAVLLMISTAIAGSVSAAPGEAQQWRLLQAKDTPCVDEPVLASVDPNSDGLLTLAELQKYAAAHPSNQMLQDLVQQAEKEGLEGIRYQDCGTDPAPSGDMPCVDQPGFASLDPNRDGVLTLDELRVIAETYPPLWEQVEEAERQGVEGIRYLDCAGDASTDTDTDVTTDTDSSSDLPCVDEKSLTGVDPNQDGVLTLDELWAIAKLHPDNDMLQDLVQQAEKEGLDGIRYRDCG